jgi:hypothetical protein
VVAREVLYVLSITFVAIWLPVFLLLDLRAVWAESTPLQRFVWLAMYILTPHNYVALWCAPAPLLCLTLDAQAIAWLAPRCWLNDTVINAYISMAPGIRPNARCHCVPKDDQGAGSMQITFIPPT